MAVDPRPPLDTYARLIGLLEEHQAQYRLIDHPPEGRTEIVSAFRGHDPRQVPDQPQASRAGNHSPHRALAPSSRRAMSAGGGLDNRRRRLGPSVERQWERGSPHAGRRRRRRTSIRSIHPESSVPSSGTLAVRKLPRERSPRRRDRPTGRFDASPRPHRRRLLPRLRSGRRQSIGPESSASQDEPRSSRRCMRAPPRRPRGLNLRRVARSHPGAAQRRCRVRAGQGQRSGQAYRLAPGSRSHRVRLGPLHR